MKKKKPPSRLKRAKFEDFLEYPKGSIVADLSKQAPNNSYSPPLYYEDKQFNCVDCGSSEIWTAEQQWEYFEVWRKPIFGEAIRCRECRIADREQRAENKERSQEGMSRIQRNGS